MKKVLIAIFVVLLVGAVGAGGWYIYKKRFAAAGSAMPAGFEPAEAAQVVAAREVTWTQTADLVGTVFALRSVTVRNELPGVVREVNFQSGDVVEAGRLLVRQDETTERADLDAARAAVRVAEANVAQAESQIALAEVELKRLTGVQLNAVAEVDVDRARNKLATAKTERQRWAAEVDQARAKVAQVEARLAKLTMTAPFKARVGMRSVHEGQYLAEGKDIVTLEELTDKIYLDFAIPQQYAPRVRDGMTVMAQGELLGPDPVQIKVVARDAMVSNETRNLRIRSIVDNPNGSLVPGMFVQVRVPIEEPRKYVVVPNTAIRRAAYAQSVFVIAPDDAGTMRAHQRFVTLGQTLGEDVMVLEGLKVGEQVAAAGSFKLRDGVKVLLGPPPAAPGAAAAPAGASAPVASAPSNDDAVAAARK